MVQFLQAQKGTGREPLGWRAFCATAAEKVSLQGAQLQVPSPALPLFTSSPLPQSCSHTFKTGLIPIFLQTGHFPQASLSVQW